MALTPRRTQQERREETRRRLLDATVGCLLRHGYAGVTTVQVAKEAGVSRGAQQHYFPKKAQLVRAAVEHLFAQRIEEFRWAMQNVPAGQDRVSAAIDALWEGVSDRRSFNPALEVIVASRTDPELSDVVRDMFLKHRETIQRTFKELFAEEIKDNPAAAFAPRFAVTFMDGLAMQQMVGQDEKEVRQMLEALKMIASMVGLSRSK
jgi:AcrR family transcriptional regulator